MKLVEIKKNNLCTKSDLIAEGVKKSHETIIKLIDRNINDFEEFGPVGFEIRMVNRHQGGGKKLRIAILNEEQATLFISMEWDFEQRKSELERVFNRNHKIPLIDELHRLAA